MQCYCHHYLYLFCNVLMHYFDYSYFLVLVLLLFSCYWKQRIDIHHVNLLYFLHCVLSVIDAFTHHMEVVLIFPHPHMSSHMLETVEVGGWNHSIYISALWVHISAFQEIALSSIVLLCVATTFFFKFLLPLRVSKMLVQFFLHL